MEMESVVAELTAQWNHLCLKRYSKDPSTYLDSRVDPSAPISLIVAKPYEELDPYLKSLFRLWALQSPLELFVREFNFLTRPVIPSVADVLVGVVLRSPSTLHNVRVSVNTFWTAHVFETLECDQPEIILGDYFLPLFINKNKAYVTLHVPDDAKIDLIFGNLGDDVKKQVQDTRLYHPLHHGTKGWLVYGGDDFAYYITNEPPQTARELPAINSWRYMAQKKLRSLEIYEEELMRVAWHPKRLLSCMDLSDSQSLSLAHSDSSNESRSKPGSAQVSEKK
jgi:hypothetical protein